jgi:hypothetical protein
MLSWTVCHEFCVLYLFHQIMAHCYGERGLYNLHVPVNSSMLQMGKAVILSLVLLASSGATTIQLFICC